jgi:hypothetical protein
MSVDIDVQRSSDGTYMIHFVTSRHGYSYTVKGGEENPRVFLSDEDTRVLIDILKASLGTDRRIMVSP